MWYVPTQLIEASLCMHEITMWDQYLGSYRGDKYENRCTILTNLPVVLFSCKSTDLRLLLHGWIQLKLLSRLSSYLTPWEVFLGVRAGAKVGAHFDNIYYGRNRTRPRAQIFECQTPGSLQRVS